MRYMGGKNRLGRRLSDFMLSRHNVGDYDGYFEPFCGSLGVFHHMTDKGFDNLEANDLHEDLIAMWQALQMNTLIFPEKFTEKDYLELKNSPSPNALKGCVGFGMSFGGMYFGTFAGRYEKPQTPDSKRREKNSLVEMRNSLNRFKPKIKEIDFYNKSYDDFTPKNKLIYCDPPYMDTIKFSTGAFDSELFWNIMRKWSKDNTVYISEYNAPDDFECVYEREVKCTAGVSNNKPRIEKLWVVRGFKKIVNNEEE